MINECYKKYISVSYNYKPYTDKMKEPRLYCLLFLMTFLHFGVSAQTNFNPLGQQNIPVQPQRQQQPQNNYQSNQQQSYNEYQKILQEQKQEELKNQPRLQYEKEQNDKLVAQMKPFNDALQSLKDMLSGKQKLSVADAYFFIENAYGGNYITYQDYKEDFKKSVAFIKTWLGQNMLNVKNKDNVNNAIQKFMSEPLTTNIKTGTLETGMSFKTTIHQPYFYDFNDYEAEKDHRSSFVTKIMATGGGQCANMPIVYIALAQMLGIKAYLSYAPNHSFVKYINSKGMIENYEPTSNWKIDDNWYIDDMFVNEDAIKSGIYLDTMNYQQIVADCVMQLADFHARKFGIDDGKFVQDCIEVASKYFPKDNNIDLCNLRMQILKVKLADVIIATRNNYPNKKLTDEYVIANVPKAQQLFKQIKTIEDHKKQLGYDEQPKGLYEEMMKHQEFGGKRQIMKGIDGTQKRNLFQMLK